MKSCTYCGKEYPDEAGVCAIDGQSLKVVIPALPAPAQPTVSEHQPLAALNTIWSTVKFYGLGLGCFLCGTMLGEVLATVVHHRFGHYCQVHPWQCWLIPLGNLCLILFMIKRARCLVRAKVAGTAMQERVVVEHYLVATAFSATPLVRLWIYGSLYCIGLGVSFLL